MFVRCIFGLVELYLPVLNMQHQCFADAVVVVVIIIIVVVVFPFVSFYLVQYKRFDYFSLNAFHSFIAFCFGQLARRFCFYFIEWCLLWATLMVTSI